MSVGIEYIPVHELVDICKERKRLKYKTKHLISSKNVHTERANGQAPMKTTDVTIF